MTLAEWLVALGSIAAIGAVYWWFFAAEARETAGGRRGPRSASRRSDREAPAAEADGVE